MAYSAEEKDKMFEEVCQKITEGKSLRSIFSGNPDLFSMPIFFEVLNDSEDKLKQYARACEIRAEGIFDEILDISDATENDAIVSPETDELIVNHNIIQRDRLRVDSRKWILSKMNPKKYGEKVQNELSGGVAVQAVINIIKPDNAND